MSNAVVPPKAMSQAVLMANMYENAEVAKSSGDARPTITMDIVCSDICKVYARMTGIELFTRILSSCNIAFQVDFQSLGSWNLSSPAHSSCSSMCPLDLDNRLDVSVGLPLLEDFGRFLGFRRKFGSHECAGPVSSIVANGIRSLMYDLPAFLKESWRNQTIKRRIHDVCYPNVKSV